MSASKPPPPVQSPPPPSTSIFSPQFGGGGAGGRPTVGFYNNGFGGGGFSSSTSTSASSSSSWPKSPKSLKAGGSGIQIENPLLKATHQYQQLNPSFVGGHQTTVGAGPSAAVPMAPSLFSQQQQQNQYNRSIPSIRSPLTDLKGMNNTNSSISIVEHQGPSSLGFMRNSNDTHLKAPQPSLFASPPPLSILKKNSKSSSLVLATTNNSTPGPPPKASLSLMGGTILPMEMNGTAALSPTLPEQNHQEPVTPVDKPNASGLLLSPPLLLQDSQNRTMALSTVLVPSTTTTTASSSADADRWVVAYGYTSLTEYHELFDLLTSFGSIEQHHQSGGNWLAVQYESRLAVERALCSQPVTLRNNTVCGTVRGTPSLLQSLWTRNNTMNYADSNNDSSSSKIVDTATTTAVATQPSNNQQQRLFIKSGRSTPRDDVDSKWLNDNDDRKNGRMDDQHRPTMTVCQKVMSWYFGWEYVPNDDDGHHHDHHPHSD